MPLPSPDNGQDPLTLPPSSTFILQVNSLLQSILALSPPKQVGRMNMDGALFVILIKECGKPLRQMAFLMFLLYAL